MTEQDYTDILQFLVSKVETALPSWRVEPGVLPFNDRGEFFSSWASSPTTDTRDSIETTDVAFALVYLTDWDTIEGPVHSPLIAYKFRIYIFQEFSLDRVDEDEVDPLAFTRRMQARHNRYVAGLLALQSEFQGNFNMGLTLSAETVVLRTTELVIAEPSVSVEECEFIPEVEGFQASFEERVEFQFKEC